MNIAILVISREELQKGSAEYEKGFLQGGP